MTLGKKEQGNALFLILMAIVLFGALAYAMNKKDNASGDNKDANIVSAASGVTRYPSGIRTGVTRMLLRGATVEDLRFNDPAHFEQGHETDEVFHLTGGGAVYEAVDPNAVVTLIPTTTHPTQNWYFTSGNKITNIGTDKNDVIAVLMDVRKSVCEQINQQITGKAVIPDAQLAEAQIIGSGNVYGPLANGQPFLCMKENGGKNFYYHVLVEE